ncbi:MAG TPA: DUF899 family protein [Streptosporangiaceae bacterium]|nr:DUF899 family protein [Streptosporangiaceae bacterium]
MTSHKTGTREEWLAARLELLQAEKALTRRTDELARQRQELPWVRIDKDYRFDTDEGQRRSPTCSEGARSFSSTTSCSRPTTPPGARPGISAFALEDGVAYHTYSAYERGLDAVWGMYQWLDRAPLGRNETSMWWRRHDEYDAP